MIVFRAAREAALFSLCRGDKEAGDFVKSIEDRWVILYYNDKGMIMGNREKAEERES